MNVLRILLQDLGVWVILSLVAVVIIGFFTDKFNAFCSTAMGIGTFFIAHIINNAESDVQDKAIAWAVVVGIWVFFRFLPVVGAQITGAETSTYLIFGTLVEDTDYSHIPIVLLLIAILSGGLGVGTFFLVQWALTSGLVFITYLICTLLTLWGGFSFVKSFFSE